MPGPEVKASVRSFFSGASIILLCVAALAAPGCSGSGETGTTRFPAARSVAEEEADAPSPETSFTYLAQNEGCRCEAYTVSDKKFPVRYTFRATYRMEGGFITSVRISVENRGRDTVFLDPGLVMVSSKNITYQYNNMFLPLPALVILPGDSEDLDLNGKEVTGSPTWKKIAGEQLTLTLKGMRMGEDVLGTQVVTFIPENPMLREPEE